MSPTKHRGTEIHSKFRKLRTPVHKNRALVTTNTIAGIKAIIALSFSGAIGILFVVLGCALKEYGIWWPMFVLFFYAFAPVPTIIARRFSDDFSSNASNVIKETAMFFTAGNVVSAFGLPIVLARCNIIKWGAMALVLSGNVFIFFTILAYFLIFSAEDDWGFWTVIFLCKSVIGFPSVVFLIGFKPYLWEMHMSQLKHYVNFINKHRKLYERVGMSDVWKVLKICELSKNITSDHKSQIAQARSYYFLFIFVYTQHYCCCFHSNFNNVLYNCHWPIRNVIFCIAYNKSIK